MRLNGLALLLKATGDYAAAEPLYRRALAIAEKAQGPEHPSTGTSLNNLALLLQATGDYAAAEPLYRRALAIAEKALGSESEAAMRSHHKLHHKLGAILRKSGKLTEAEDELRIAVGLGGKFQKGAPFIELADLREQQGRLDEAEELLKRALEIRQAALPAGDASITEGVNRLADLYERMGRMEEAAQLRQKD